MLNWIVWNRTVYMYKNRLGINDLQWLMHHKTKLNHFFFLFSSSFLPPSFSLKLHYFLSTFLASSLLSLPAFLFFPVCLHVSFFFHMIPFWPILSLWLLYASIFLTPLDSSSSFFYNFLISNSSLYGGALVV